MRTMLFGAALAAAATLIPTAGAQAQRYHGPGYGYDRGVQQERRECARELRRADSRREYRRELRECRREIRQAVREDRRDDRRDWRRWDRQDGWGRYDDRRRYWDGYRWRYR